MIETKTNDKDEPYEDVTAMQQVRYGMDESMNYRDRLRSSLEHMHGHRIGCTRQQQLRMLYIGMRFNRDKNIHIRPYH